MKRRKQIISLVFALFLCLCFISCGISDEDETDVTEKSFSQDAKFVFYKIAFNDSPLPDNVKKYFESDVKDYPDEECVDCTPDGITDFALYKYKSSTKTLLLYKKNIYAIGGWFGGCGVTEIAIAEDVDGKYLIYNYSCGSGITSSSLGVFSFKSQRHFAADRFFNDIVTFAEKDGRVVISKAEMSFTDNGYECFDTGEELSDIYSIKFSLIKE